MLVHGDNIHAKLNHRTKYRDETSRQYLEEIKDEYDRWVEGNAALLGPAATADPAADAKLVAERTELFRAYKEFIDQKKYAERFDSRSNLHSSVLEEFLYYLFRDLVASFGDHALIGKSHAFKDLFFVPPSYEAMLERPYAQVEHKDHDFVIGATVTASLRTRPPLEDVEGDEGDAPDPINVQVPPNESDTEELEVYDPSDYGAIGVVEGAETLTFDVPAIAIECKTYLDKTMLEGSSRAADEIKARNPSGLYYVVCERLKLSAGVNLKKYSVDQIYVLRQERNIDREYRLLDTYEGNPIAAEVVQHLFDSVRDALITDWSVGLDTGIERGWLIE
jgi:hypothetical protein